MIQRNTGGQRKNTRSEVAVERECGIQILGKGKNAERKRQPKKRRLSETERERGERRTK